MQFFSNQTFSEQIMFRIHRGGFFFSIFSLVTSTIALFLLSCNKTLRSLTYNFLVCVFISEIFGSIGNICEYQIKEEDNEKLLCKGASLFLIPFSDMFTMLLLCFFSYCSFELIKKTNRKIKEKEKKFFFISGVIAVVYSLIIFSILYFAAKEKTHFYYYVNSSYNFIRFIHIGFLMVMTCYISWNIFIVIQFLREKQKSDKINSWKIAKLNKFLFRFPLIGFLYWFFYLLSLPLSYFDDSKDKKITFIVKLFSTSFFSLRGFLIFLNVMQTNKVQIFLERFFEIYIKHKCILSLDLFSKKRRESKEKLMQKEKDLYD